MADDPRYAQLNAWLKKHNALPFWDGEIGYTNLTGYNVNGRFVIVMHLPDGGWDLFVQASLTNDISATLKAAELACGIPG
jgi:hypothetical protein